MEALSALVGYGVPSWCRGVCPTRWSVALYLYKIGCEKVTHRTSFQHFFSGRSGLTHSHTPQPLCLSLRLDAARGRPLVLVPVPCNSKLSVCLSLRAFSTFSSLDIPT